MFKIKIETDNAAFEEGGASAEVARILRELAGDLERSGLCNEGDGKLRDLNGNTVGDWKLTPPR